MKLAVGFLTYNDTSAKYLADFLPSLKEALGFLESQEYQVLVFDNSDQGNHRNKEILELFNEQNNGFLEYISADSNLGFSRAYNILLHSATRLGAEYFFMVNPDTLLEKNTISELVLALDKNNDLASASPKIRCWDFAANTKTRVLDTCGLIVKPGLRFYDLGQGEKDDKRFDFFKIFGPSGAAGIFRLSALEKIKENNQYFDEQFFMYKEDCDLAYRLFLAGFKSALVPSAIMYHDRTASSAGRGLLRKIFNRSKKSRQIRSWSFRNQHLIFIKHWTKQNLFSQAIIILRVLAMGVFSLILEQYLLKEYKNICSSTKRS
ncbi:glycosyltransferase family 2 protein [Candidatus Falkowbacteria bacterium]|jgi:GT2 family glycosyltransferase|nr:glycosyltransferase family 2 protein [Candidatus Falkowbacteria bacterium]